MPGVMTRQAEARILDATDRVADLVSAGESPNDAIVKVAQDVQLPRGHLPLLVNAYNIGRSAHQRNTGSSTLEKAADFEVADLVAVRRALYPESHGAGKAAAFGGVSAEYSRPPSWYHEHRAKVASQTLVKQAAATPAAPAAPPLPRDEFYEVKKAHARCRHRANRLAAVKQAAAAAERNLLLAFDRLDAYFRAPGSLKVADVRGNAVLVHGRAGGAVLDQVCRERPSFAKAAASDPYHEVSRSSEPYRSLADAVEWSAKYLDAAKLRDAAAKEAAALDEADLTPFRPASRETLVDRLEKKADVSIPGKGVYDALNGLSQKATPEDDPASKMMSRIATPEHEMRLRAIQARAMLHEMLNSDDVLSGHDPYEVARHYNQFSQLAPHSSTQPMVAIPAVRKSVAQGGLDTFDADNIVGTESKLRANHSASKGKGKKDD